MDQQAIPVQERASPETWQRSMTAIGLTAIDPLVVAQVTERATQRAKWDWEAELRLFGKSDSSEVEVG